MSDGTGRARACANIALAKYWGKSDIERNLPAVPSVSVTLDALVTETSVALDRSLARDEVSLDGSLVREGEEADRASELLEGWVEKHPRDRVALHTLAGLAERAAACLTERARVAAILVDDRALAAADPVAYLDRLRGIPPLTPCLDAVVLAATPARADDASLRARALLWAAKSEVDHDRAAAAAATLAQARAVMPADDDGARALALVVEGGIAYDERRCTCRRWASWSSCTPARSATRRRCSSGCGWPPPR